MVAMLGWSTNKCSILVFIYIPYDAQNGVVKWKVKVLSKWNYSIKLEQKYKVVQYLGDLSEEEKVLQWLTSQDVFEIKDEIEEVNRKMLDKLLEENEFVAVYFCKLKKYQQFHVV